MKNVVDETIKLLEAQEKLYEMVNIHTMDTGLKGMLYATYNGKDEGYPHSVRVKVILTDKTLFPILINKGKVYPLNTGGKYNKLEKDDKDIVDEAVNYVEANKEIFIKHWNGEITDKMLLNMLPHI